MSYLDNDAIPLAAVVGGRVDLLNLIEELEKMYPDRFPNHTITEKEMAFQAGAVAVIRYLKQKTEPT